MNRIGLFIVMMIALIIFVPEPVVGQTPDPGSATVHSPSDMESLPSWAEPMPAAPTDQPVWPGGAEGPAGTHAPPLPPPGSRVPVDGGLLWLMAAGGLFAIYRLRNPSPELSSP